MNIAIEHSQLFDRCLQEIEPYLIRLANSHKSWSLPAEDIAQELRMHAIDLAVSFDPDYGPTWMQYAVPLLKLRAVSVLRRKGVFTEHGNRRIPVPCSVVSAEDDAIENYASERFVISEAPIDVEPKPIPKRRPSKVIRESNPVDSIDEAIDTLASTRGQKELKERIAYHEAELLKLTKLQAFLAPKTAKRKKNMPPHLAAIEEMIIDHVTRRDMTCEEIADQIGSTNVVVGQIVGRSVHLKKVRRKVTLVKSGEVKEPTFP